MNICRIAAILASTASLCACATVTRSTKETFRIVSEPPGATANMSTGDRCITPCQWRVRRKTQFTLSVQKEGYETVEVAVKRSVKGGGIAGAAGNLVIGGTIGLVVDSLKGSIFNLTPNPVIVKLQPLPLTPRAIGDAPEAVAVPSSAPAPRAATSTAGADAVASSLKG